MTHPYLFKKQHIPLPWKRFKDLASKRWQQSPGCFFTPLLDPRPVARTKLHHSTALHELNLVRHTKDYFLKNLQAWNNSKSWSRVCKIEFWIFLIKEAVHLSSRALCKRALYLHLTWIPLSSLFSIILPQVLIPRTLLINTLCTNLYLWATSLENTTCYTHNWKSPNNSFKYRLYTEGIGIIVQMRKDLMRSVWK